MEYSLGETQEGQTSLGVKIWTFLKSPDLFHRFGGCRKRRVLKPTEVMIDSVNFANKENFLISKVVSFIPAQGVSAASVLSSFSCGSISPLEHCECELFQHSQTSFHNQQCKAYIVSFPHPGFDATMHALF